MGPFSWAFNSEADNKDMKESDSTQHRGLMVVFFSKDASTWRANSHVPAPSYSM